jgi:hypothetical protein
MTAKEKGWPGWAAVKKLPVADAPPLFTVYEYRVPGVSP